jgi:hypothetical protein
MSGWQRDFLSYPGRELLIKSILSAIPTYFMTAFKMPKWAYVGIFCTGKIYGGQDHVFLF